MTKKGKEKGREQKEKEKRGKRMIFSGGGSLRNPSEKKK
jgi:hypothetical protein